MRPSSGTSSSSGNSARSTSAPAGSSRGATGSVGPTATPDGRSSVMSTSEHPGLLCELLQPGDGAEPGDVIELLACLDDRARVEHRGLGRCRGRGKRSERRREVEHCGGPPVDVVALAARRRWSAPEERRRLQDRAVGGSNCRTADVVSPSKRQKLVVRVDEPSRRRRGDVNGHPCCQQALPAPPQPPLPTPTPGRPNRQDAPEGQGEDAEHPEDAGRVGQHCPGEQPGSDHDEADVEPAGALVDVGEEVVDQPVEVVGIATLTVTFS